MEQRKGLSKGRLFALGALAVTLILAGPQAMINQLLGEALPYWQVFLLTMPLNLTMMILVGYASYSWLKTRRIDFRWKTVIGFFVVSNVLANLILGDSGVVVNLTWEVVSVAPLLYTYTYYTEFGRSLFVASIVAGSVLGVLVARILYDRSNQGRESQQGGTG